MSLTRMTYVLILFFLAGCSGESTINDPENVTLNERYFLIEENGSNFAQPITDRTQWQEHRLGRIPLQDKNIWVQADFMFGPDERDSQGLYIFIVGTHEAFWDGEYLGQNGVVGRDKNTEKPGQVESVLLLTKAQSSPGPHTLSLNIALHHNDARRRSGEFSMLVNDYEFLIQRSHKQTRLPMLMGGALLLIAVYCLILYFSDFKEISWLWFSCLCFSILMLSTAESWRGLWGYSYDWHIPRLNIVLVLASLVSLLMTLFFASYFTLPRKARVLAVTTNVLLQIPILLVVDSHDMRSLLVFLIGVGVSSLICVHAVLKAQKNARLVLAGLFAFVAPIFLSTHFFMEQYFFLSFSALIMLMLYSLKQTMQQKQMLLVQSQITRGRLELELIKRNIQPHFILNTLTAIEEWIEDSPEEAIKFIHALADEFRYMAQVSTQTLVAVKDEIALCRSHLRVMGFRSNIEFELVSADLEKMTQIPPGIFLTLIENAISHNRYRKGRHVFQLQQSFRDKMTVFCFTAPVVNPKKTGSINTGTGVKYIEMRLNESFADAWSMKSNLAAQQWQVEICVPYLSDPGEELRSR